MLKIEQNGPKQWAIIYDDNIIDLRLQSSSITNKFFILTNFVQGISNYYNDEFDKWFFNLIDSCKDEENKSKNIFLNIQQLKDFVNGYIDSENIDFSKFVDESKAKKNSILFMPDEIEKIIKLSGYLKVYSFISNSETLKVGQRLHTEIYNKIASDIIDTEIIRKIFNIVKTKTFRYNLTDRAMWDYIKTVQCKDIGIHVIEIFNFIMNNILVLCETDRNPITYFVGVIDESVKWFLRSVYKGSIVYDDSVSTEDIQGINVNNLKTYSYNDTLGRLKGIAFEKIYEDLEKNISVNLEPDEHIFKFHNRVSQIEYVSPLSECLVYPILSKATEIPYNYFKTLSPEHSAVLSYYLFNLLTKIFKSDYKDLFSLLAFYPVNSPAISTTYTIKAINEFVNFQNDIQNFYGFKTKILPHKLVCNFVGRVSRINFCNIITGKRLAGIPLSKIEKDMIIFYTLFFAGELENKFGEVISLINSDF